MIMMVVMMATVLKISSLTACSSIPLQSSINQPKALVAREVYQVDITTTIVAFIKARGLEERVGMRGGVKRESLSNSVHRQVYLIYTMFRKLYSLLSSCESNLRPLLQDPLPN
jgi:hypothetical protein